MIKCKLGKNSRKAENYAKINEFQDRLNAYIDRKYKKRENIIKDLAYSTDKETNKQKERY